MWEKETISHVYGVFEGGGARGSALVGGVAAIEKQNITFRSVAGTSAGAIVASLVAAGYSATELLNMMLDNDFKDFLVSMMLDKDFKDFLVRMR